MDIRGILKKKSSINVVKGYKRRRKFLHMKNKIRRFIDAEPYNLQPIKL